MGEGEEEEKEDEDVGREVLTGVWDPKRLSVEKVPGSKKNLRPG